MLKPLKILYVTAELSPLISTGGLADVAAALPRALHAMGHDVRLAMPCYGAIPPAHRGVERCMCVAQLGDKVSHGALREATVPDTDIPLYLVDHAGYFGRTDSYGSGAYEFEDNAERFCFFCLAVLDAIPQLRWRPDVIHCHDWHAAAIPIYLKTRSLRDPSWQKLPTLLTIHNLNYQGRYPASRLARTGIPKELFTPECLEYYGDINLMKGGLTFASRLNTVSPRYAQEIRTPDFGAGLDGVLDDRKIDLVGILNGVDYAVWNPATDSHVAANYDRDDLSGKAICKAELQKSLGLAQRDVPMFGLVTRISWQKGVDILLEAADEILAHDLQMVVLGTGDPFYENGFREAMERYPGKLAAEIRFDIPRSHQIEAGCDFFLMPSRYEPCGLSQMYSLAYGTVPIVHKTGGLADSVTAITPANLRNGRATGIVFSPCEASAIVRSVEQALDIYAKPDTLAALRLNGMAQDFSWERSAQAYLALYRKAMANP